MEETPLKIIGKLNVGVVGGNVQTSKTVNPQTEQILVRPDEGFDALEKVYVNAVTNTIDENIVAGNIKEGVEILGITGSYEQGYFPSITNNTLVFGAGDREITVNESELILS